jgi:hypothetical protein
VPPVLSPKPPVPEPHGYGGELAVRTTAHLQAAVRGWATAVLTGCDTVTTVSLGRDLDGAPPAGPADHGLGPGSDTVSPLAPQAGASAMVMDKGACSCAHILRFTQQAVDGACARHCPQSVSSTLLGSWRC